MEQRDAGDVIDYLLAALDDVQDVSLLGFDEFDNQTPPAPSRLQSGSISSGSINDSCLHSDHEQPCLHCKEAPGPADWPMFELSGDKGKKNGAKVLRSLIRRSPQWSDVECRHSAAQAATAAGLERIVRALLEGHVVGLRKDEMLWLGHFWRLRSSIWHPRRVMAATSATPVTADTAVSEKRVLLDQPQSSASEEPKINPVDNVLDVGSLQLSFSVDRTVVAAPVDSPLFVLAVQHNVIPRITQLTAQAQDILSARDVRDVSFAIRGADFTATKLQEMRGVLKAVEAVASVMDSMCAASSVRLLRLKEYGPLQTMGGQLLTDMALQNDDLKFEEFSQNMMNWQQAKIIPLRASLVARQGQANVGVVFDRMMLRAWENAMELKTTQLSVLEWARRSGSAQTYTEASVLLQDAGRQHRIGTEMALLYQTQWMEDLIRYVVASKQREAEGSSQGSRTGTSATWEEAVAAGGGYGGATFGSAGGATFFGGRGSSDRGHSSLVSGFFRTADAALSRTFDHQDPRAYPSSSDRLSALPAAYPGAGRLDTRPGPYPGAVQGEAWRGTGAARGPDPL